MIKKQGFSLIELIIFIVLLGIGIGVLVPLVTTARHLHRIDQQTIAIELAQQRIELILAQKQLVGFANFGDPCANSSPPTICTPPPGYTIAPQTISNNGDHSKTITVAVSGLASATLQTLVTDY